LSDADLYLDTIRHSGVLDSGASYTGTDTLKAPKGLTGPWYLFVLTDPPTVRSPIGTVFEGSNEGNNATPTATPLLIDPQPPSDLVVSSITVPTSAQAGDPVHIKWTITNTGVNPASGTWTDAAYLSADAIWGFTDPIIGRFKFTGTLAPGASYDAVL